MRTAPDEAPDLKTRREAYAHYVQLKGWAKPFSYDWDMAAAFRGELGTADLADKALLEIGFGEGGLLAWAQDHGGTVAGVEINADCVAEAQRRGIEVLPADLAAAAEINAARFDYIVAFDVFEHLSLPEIVASLDACAAMLKPSGRLLLRFPNAQSPFGLAVQYGDVTHVTPLSGEQLRQITIGLPLEMVAVRGAYRVRGRGPARFVVRAIRYLLQDMIGLLVRFVFMNPAPIAPVVTAVLKLRQDDRPDDAAR